MNARAWRARAAAILLYFGAAVSFATEQLAMSIRDAISPDLMGPDLMLIGPGKFVQGSPTSEVGRDQDEGPLSTVSLDRPFYLGRTEITVGQFAAFVADTGYETDAEVTGCLIWEDGRLKSERRVTWLNLPGFASSDEHPVVCVSWRDAMAYATWLSEKTEQDYRLPSEAEWEYAVRAGSVTARFWGDDPDDACPYANVADRSFAGHYPTLERVVHDCEDGNSQAAPVGNRRANGFGLHDMLGNVWEWTCTAYVPAYDGHQIECPPTSVRERRVLRGGAWYLSPASVRSAHRNAGSITSQTVSVGFRVVRTAVAH